MSPDVLDRIEFGRIRRQTLRGDASVETLKVIPDHRAAVSGKSVPNDEKLSRYGSLQVLQKNDQVRSFDRFREQFEIEAPQRQSGDERQVLPVEIVEENRSLPAGSPGPAAVRALAQSAFIDKYYRAPLLAGFFLRPANLPSSTFQSPPHLSLRRAQPAVVATSPDGAEPSIHDRDDSEPGTPA